MIYLRDMEIAGGATEYYVCWFRLQGKKYGDNNR